MLADIPISYGLLDVKMDPLVLNSVEVLWNADCDAGVFVKVNCISTEFTARKHGGEKGVPFRIQIETYASTADGRGANSSDVSQQRLLHCASCQIKVFKVCFCMGAAWEMLHTTSVSAHSWSFPRSIDCAN
jgi:transcription factor CP2 and related proteins